MNQHCSGNEKNGLTLNLQQAITWINEDALQKAGVDVNWCGKKCAILVSLNSWKATFLFQYDLIMYTS